MRKSRKSAHHIARQPVYSYSRLTIISGLSVLLLIFGFLSVNKHTISQSVAGASIFNPMLYTQGTVSWSSINGAKAYNIYYKATGETIFSNAVRNLPATMTTYHISYLKKNVSYQYRISALNYSGREFWWSDILPITTISSM